MTSTDELVDVFVDVGMACAERGIVRSAAKSLAVRLVAEGHEDALRDLAAEVWTARTARLAHADRWAAYEKVRASLDKTGQEPPPPPQPEPDPQPEPTPPPDPEPGQ